MNPKEMNTTGVENGRKWRMWWAVDDYGATHFVKGYSCEPNEGYWWVPELGYSMSEKYHLFPSEEQAHASAVEMCEKQIKLWQGRLSQL